MLNVGQFWQKRGMERLFFVYKDENSRERRKIKGLGGKKT